MRKITTILSPLLSFDYMYTADQGAEVLECVSEITNMEALAWNKSGARQTCYANLFSKLFLAWLAAEIQKGGFLHLTYRDLEELKMRPLDVLCMFYYDDIGYQTAVVIDKLIERVLKRSKILRYLSVPLMEFRNSGNEGEKAMEELACDLKTVCPSMEDLVDIMPDTPALCLYEWGTAYEMGLVARMVESELLYKIWEMEKKSPTPLGQDIIALTRIFADMTAGCHFGLEGKTKFDDKTQVFRALSYSTMLDLWGEGCDFEEPVHIFDFGFLLQFAELEEKVEKYCRELQMEG